ncbi:DUF7562 family protein [Halospeciosus flavus]|uniref:Small CPxCG-related zinc finger protein n=1 Tax=Halospeciosus flavus TaxID=3032283 RepID=A0ABD5Z5Y3_9EURY|nr:hypothetical protein [Halospeciosus flavus]
MWTPGSDASVTCIACGEDLDREQAREYDKYGDRWDRDGKEFEYLCKSCYRGLSKADRAGLESLLVDVGAGSLSNEEFLHRYVDAARTEGDSERTK